MRARPLARRPAWLVVAACCVFDLGHAPPRVSPGPAREPAGARAALERGFAEAAGGVSGRRRSIPLFREAQRLDPRLAEAHYAIAETYLDLAREGGLSPRPALIEARQAADRAIEIEDRPETRLVRGWIRLQLDGDVEGAATDFGRALSLAPRNPSVLAALSRFHSVAGSEQEALDLMARAEALSPSCDLIAHDAAMVFYRARRFGEAAERFARAEELGTPRGLSRAEWQARNREGALWARLATSGDASAEVSRFLESRGLSPAQIRRFRASGPDPTRRFLEGSVRRIEGQPGSTIALVRLHAALGHRSEAMRYLSLAASTPSLDLIELLSSPAVDALRSDPAFPGLRSMAFGARPRLAPRTLVAALARVSGPAPN
jgi:tetratricopeptide (TPR) repeat protein